MALPCNAQPCQPLCPPFYQGWQPTVGCARPVRRMTGYDPNAAPPAWTPGSAPWSAKTGGASLLAPPPLWAQALYAQYFGSGQGPSLMPLG